MSFTFECLSPIIVGAAHSAAYTNFIARTSGLNTTHLNAYAALLDGLTADGIFNTDGTSSFLDALYVFATDTTTNANLNLVSSSYTITPQTTPTFTADHGYTGNGTDYLDTNFDPASGTNYLQNSASGGCYTLTSRTADQTWAEMGSSEGGTRAIRFIPVFSGGAGIWTINGSQFIVGFTSNVQGQFILTRTSSSLINMYKNGNTTPIDTQSSATSGSLVVGATMTVLGENNSGIVGNKTSDQLASFFLGGGLSSANMALLAARINTYMTTFGINVY